MRSADGNRWSARRCSCLLLLLLAAVPAAGSEIQIIDGATGAARTFSRSSGDLTEGPELIRWTDDGAALLVKRDGEALRVGVAIGSVQDAPAYDFVVSIGPGGRFLETVLGRSKHTRIRLRGPDRRSLGGTHDFGSAYAESLIAYPEPSIAWSADDARVAIADAPFLYVLDTATGAVVLRRRIPYDQLGAQAFAPDASALLLTDYQRLLRVDLPSGKATVLLRTGKLDNDPPRARYGEVPAASRSGLESGSASSETRPSTWPWASTAQPSFSGIPTGRR